MNRAAVLIGVRDTRRLPQLQTVYDGISRMENWARSQGITSDSLEIITDEHGPVSAVDILQKITRFVDSLTYEQLIIYYTGHGMNLGQSEYWLLSNAPDDPTTIVNLSATMERARTSTVPHVVFISDACRTPAGTIVDQLGAQSGMAVFPNPSQSGIGRFKSVDVFYATVLGRPSLEVKNDEQFKGVYTEALVDALNGTPPMEPETDQQSGKNVIRAWPLRKFLDLEIPKRLFTYFPNNTPSQAPDAIISSAPDSWLSEISISRSGPSSPEPSTTPDEPPRQLSIQSFTQNTLRGALDQESIDLHNIFAVAKSGDAENETTQSFQNIAFTTTQPFNRISFETMCGFLVQGARIVEAHSKDADVEILEEEQSACRIYMRDNKRFSPVVLTFDNGKSTILPAINEFMTGLKFDPQAAELIDVSYEPVEYSGRWQRFHDQWLKLRGLRGIIAASSQMGTFQLEGDNADKVARDMQMEKSVDPSLAVYAAYAYRKQGNNYRLEEMCDYLYGDFGMVLFDAAMLAGRLPSDTQTDWEHVSPATPMLTQGWAILDAFELELPHGLSALRAHIDYSSLWTLYNAQGAALLKDYISTDGE